MIWSSFSFGGGDSFGILYFTNSIGLASKSVSDGGMGGTGFLDIRKGTDSLQYENNGGKMPAFSMISFAVDTHFNARGRLGRLPAVLVDIKSSLGIGIDERTALYYDNEVGTVYGYNGVVICSLEEATINPLTYFTASGIRSHYLSAGDQYDFAIKKVVSSK